MKTIEKSAIPADAKRVPLRPLALGEKTGHHHSLVLEEAEGVSAEEAGVLMDDAMEMYEKDGETFVRVKAAGVKLVHQEHKAHEVPAGDYKVVTQQENTDWGARPVAD